MSVIIETTIGSITIDLYTKERPRTCLNFLKLCKLKYYNFKPFYEIIKNFIVKGGRDIFNGRKNGESIYYFIYGESGRYFESEKKIKLKHIDLGTISMINNNEGLIGSEFFITLNKNLNYLDSKHTVFGKVVDGFEFLDKINQIWCDKENKPFKYVLITHTVILNDPFDDPDGIIFPENSPEPTEELLTLDDIYLENNFLDQNEKSNEELEEEIKDKEAKSRAIILEMIGDLPNADVTPPDNVLFICKLNPVTREEDLRVIFSRFGKILDCEIIKDSKTKESLQYAFIEFENAKDCEKAYFKMDNVLIDDRRIHIDFSQSVMKYKWKKKNKDTDNKNINFDDLDKKNKLINFSKKERYQKSRYDNYGDKGKKNYRDYDRRKEKSFTEKKKIKFEEKRNNINQRNYKDKERDFERTNQRKDKNYEDWRISRNQNEKKSRSKRSCSNEIFNKYSYKSVDDLKESKSHKRF